MTTNAGGPRVVAVGGGHGLAATLCALRSYASSVVAVVSVADDGGSSGRLRELIPELPAPGDVRRCLSALADEGSVLGASLEHRYAAGELRGHAFGNLLLATLAEQLGSFGAAVDEVARLVGAAGQVLPATSEPVRLEGLCSGDGCGFAPGMDHVVGQVALQNTSGLTRLRLRPVAPVSSPAVRDAILAADQVVLGPGSLFTSVLAAAITPAVRDAMAATAAQRVYVANLAPQVPETEGFTTADEVAALAAHGVPVDVVLADVGRPCGTPPHAVRCVEAQVATDGGAVHDPVRLAEALPALLR